MATLDDLIAQAVKEEEARIAAIETADRAAKQAKHLEAKRAFQAYVQRVFPGLHHLSYTNFDLLTYEVDSGKEFAASRHDIVLVVKDGDNTWRIRSSDDDDYQYPIWIYPADQHFQVYGLDHIPADETNAERCLLLDIARYRKEHAQLPALAS